MFGDPSEVSRIACIGGGPIGGGWTAHFLAQGYDVTTYLHSEAEVPAFRTILETAWESLSVLGLSDGASLERLTTCFDLRVAVEGAQFIQESAPERLDLKQALYSTLGDIVPSGFVIGSSTSGLMMTDIQAHCSTPERTVIGHPFNPPYLLPLVEIVGGRQTAPEAVAWAGRENPQSNTGNEAKFSGSK